jgi:hypothetical protein
MDETLPLCEKGVLDIKNHLKGRCQMKWLNMKEIVNCVDTLAGKGRNDPIPQDDSKYLNFVFIGDSRVRQLFFNFVKVLKNIKFKKAVSNIYFGIS